MLRPPLRSWPALVLLSQACANRSSEWTSPVGGVHRENSMAKEVNSSGVDTHSGTPLPTRGPAARSSSDLDAVVMKVNDSESAWGAGTGGYGCIISCAIGTDASDGYVTEAPPLSPSSLPSPSPTASSLAPIALISPYRTPQTSPLLPTPRSAFCPSPLPSPPYPSLLTSSPPPEDNLCQQGNRNKTLSPGGAAGIAMACIVLHLAICAAGAIWLELAERSTQASPGGKLKAHCDNTLSKVESSCSHRVVCPTVQGVQVVPAAVQGVQVHEVQEQVHKRVSFSNL